MLTNLVIVAGLLIVLIVVGAAYATFRREDHDAQTLAESLAMGMNQPPSLHPIIDLETCIGSAACVEACPESVLGRVSGVTQLIQAGNCIGHGRCHASCPVNAIALVFGTAERGVDIPLLRAGYESNVDGVFIVGELGGMGLIRNTMRQGIKAVEIGVPRVLKAIEHPDPDPRIKDVVIVGAGPAGIATALACTEKGYSFELLEQFTLGGSVTHYPRRKLVFTEQIKLPIAGKFGKSEMLKEELVAEFERVCMAGDVTIHEGRRVDSVLGEVGDFRVTCKLDDGSRETYRGRTIVLAIGRRGTPRRLGIPGEDLPHVVYRLIDPEQYRHRKVLCVGGGDSSVEAAVACAMMAGTEVHLSYRGEAFFRVKNKNRQELERVQAEGRLKVHLHTNVLSLTEETAVIEHIATGERETLAATDVIINVGGVLPTAFLESIGVQVETKFGDLAMPPATGKFGSGRTKRPSTRRVSKRVSKRIKKAISGDQLDPISEAISEQEFEIIRRDSDSDANFLSGDSPDPEGRA